MTRYQKFIFGNYEILIHMDCMKIFARLLDYLLRKSDITCKQEREVPYYN